MRSASLSRRYHVAGSFLPVGFSHLESERTGPQRGSRSNGTINNDPLSVCMFTHFSQTFPRVCSAESVYGTSVDTNPLEGLNPTITVENTEGLCPRIPWKKSYVFFLTIEHQKEDRCFLRLCYGNPFRAETYDFLSCVGCATGPHAFARSRGATSFIN